MSVGAVGILTSGATPADGTGRASFDCTTGPSFCSLGSCEGEGSGLNIVLHVMGSVGRASDE